MITIKFKPLLLLFFLILTVFLSGCSSLSNPKEVQDFNKSIKEMIISKDDGYDFLGDDEYMSLLKDLIGEFAEIGDISPEHIAIGNVSNTNIPELVVFRQRDQKNIKDEGYLELYGFNGETYSLIDKVSMHFDNTNYQIAIGRLSKDENGIYLNNQAGAHSGITYGFILRDRKLVSILNPKKINLISTDTDNSIEDINGDGILEFSISTPDPEIEVNNYSNPTNIKLWYQWDGKDGAILYQVDRESPLENLLTKSSKDSIFEHSKKLLDNSDDSLVNYLVENQEFLSEIDNSKIIKDYIAKLKSTILSENEELGLLVSDLAKNNSMDKLSDKYNISLDLINDLDYLRRQKVLESEKELKELLILNLNRGYKLSKINSSYEYIVNYKLFLDYFAENILNEYKDYLKILSSYNNLLLSKNTNTGIGLEELAERIIPIENFKLTYPYSEDLKEINSYYEEYLDLFFSLNKEDSTKDVPKLNAESNDINLNYDLSQGYEALVDKYSHTYLADLITEFLSNLHKK